MRHFHCSIIFRWHRSFNVSIGLDKACCPEAAGVSPGIILAMSAFSQPRCPSQGLRRPCRNILPCFCRVVPREDLYFSLRLLSCSRCVARLERERLLSSQILSVIGTKALEPPFCLKSGFSRSATDFTSKYLF